MADEDYESDIDSVSSSDSEGMNKSKTVKKTAIVKNIGLEEEEDPELSDDSDEDNDDDIDDDAEVDAEELEDLVEDETAEINQKQFSITDFDADLESDEEDEDDDTNYLQKFGEDCQKQIIQEYHPELVAHNTEEIEALSRVIRDENGIIIDPFHKTIPILSRYEKARILGERAKQLNSGAQPFIEVDETMIDGYLIALKELESKKIPFIIQRPLPDGGSEYWSLRDLEIL
jgi:DNA-directed RNA polymerase subunit K/omega